MNNANELVREFRLMKPDYEYDDDVMCEDDRRIKALKYIINKRLNTADRTIIIMYADLQSLRKVGERLGVSHATIRTEVMRIRKIIMQEYERLVNDCSDNGIRR